MVIDLTSSSPQPNPDPPLLGTSRPVGSASEVATLPASLANSITGLSRASHRLLLRKAAWLKTHTVAIPADMSRNGTGGFSDATLLFGQEEAGTAVCISPKGILMSCSHCVAESEAELDDRSHWLIFASGRIVEAKCIAWDGKRDLALLKVVAAQVEITSSSRASRPPQPTFPHVQPADITPPLGSRLVCIGHPGSEDLEAATPGVETGFDVLHLSTGTYRGCAAGQDPQDNSEIGALMHNCWTYWGHSGAPLVDRRSGRLIGLHSSWDDKTGMRRGISLEAILAFLRVNQQKLEE